MRAESAALPPRRLLAAALLLGLLGCLLDQSMQPARTHSAKPAGPGKAMEPVAYVLASTPLADDDNDAALLNAQNLVPGHPLSNCITVSGSSATTGKVTFGASAVSGTLAAHLYINVAVGDGGSFGDCAGFVGSSFYSGTLAALASQTDAATGVQTPWDGADGTSRTFRVTVEVADSNVAQSSASSADLVWTLVSAPMPTPTTTPTTTQSPTTSPTATQAPTTSPTATQAPTPTPTPTATSPVTQVPSPTIMPTASPVPTSTETPTPTATTPSAPQPSAAPPVLGDEPSLGKGWTDAGDPADRRPTASADDAPRSDTQPSDPSNGDDDGPDGEAVASAPPDEGSGPMAAPSPLASTPGAAEQPTAVAAPPQRETFRSPSLLAAARYRLEELSASLAHFAQGLAKRSGFPIALIILVGLFLALQDRLDRKDPKLALAPLHDEPHLRFPAPATFERTDQNKGRS